MMNLINLAFVSEVNRWTGPDFEAAVAVEMAAQAKAEGHVAKSPASPRDLSDAMAEKSELVLNALSGGNVHLRTIAGAAGLNVNSCTDVLSYLIREGLALRSRGAGGVWLYSVKASAARP
jgi:hypothetical protein